MTMFSTKWIHVTAVVCTWLFCHASGWNSTDGDIENTTISAWANSSPVPATTGPSNTSASRAATWSRGPDELRTNSELELLTRYLTLHWTTCPYVKLCTLGQRSSFDHGLDDSSTECCHYCSCNDGCRAAGNCCPDYELSKFLGNVSFDHVDELLRHIRGAALPEGGLASLTIPAGTRTARWRNGQPVTPPGDWRSGRDSTVTPPGGSISGRDSTVTPPGGSSSSRDSTVTPPGGLSYGRDSTVTPPVGSRPGRNSTVTPPGGSSSGRDSTVTPPVGSRSGRDSEECARLQVPVMGPQGTAYRMITSCPPDYSDREVAQKCEEPLLLHPDITHHNPVVSAHNRTYKNKFCLRCHIPPTDQLVYTLWTPVIHCKLVSMATFSFDSPAALIAHFLAGQSSHCILTFRPPATGDAEPCLRVDYASCPADYPDEQLSAVCETFYLPVHGKIGSVDTYRNVACYVCRTNTPPPERCIDVYKTLSGYDFHLNRRFFESGNRHDAILRSPQTNTTCNQGFAWNSLSVRAI